MGNTLISRDFMERMVKKGIEKEIEEALKKAIENAQKEVERHIVESTTRISLNVMKYISMKTRGEEFVITINMKGESK